MLVRKLLLVASLVQATDALLTKSRVQSDSAPEQQLCSQIQTLDFLQHEVDDLLKSGESLALRQMSPTKEEAIKKWRAQFKQIHPRKDWFELVHKCKQSGHWAAGLSKVDETIKKAQAFLDRFNKEEAQQMSKAKQVPLVAEKAARKSAFAAAGSEMALDFAHVKKETAAAMKKAKEAAAAKKAEEAATAKWAEEAAAAKKAGEAAANKEFEEEAAVKKSKEEAAAKQTEEAAERKAKEEAERKVNAESDRKAKEAEEEDKEEAGAFLSKLKEAVAQQNSEALTWESLVRR